VTVAGVRPSVLAGLVGAGIGASLSPQLHECEADLHGLRLVYRLIDLEALGLDVGRAPDLLAAARQVGFAGLNITHPCKQVVLGHLDELSPDAAAVGAVNTVIFGGGRSVGHNTDWFGFARSIERGLRNAASRRVVLLGAGGAGAAVAYAILRLGAGQVTVLDLDSRRTDALVDRMRARFGAARVTGADLDRLQSCLATADGLVHATPVGMAAHPGLPFPIEFLRSQQWVADLVYAPLQTPLLRGARALGCRTLTGGGMLAFQAAEAFRLFTGIKPDADRMMRHFDAITGGRRGAQLAGDGPGWRVSEVPA